MPVKNFAQALSIKSRERREEETPVATRPPSASDPLRETAPVAIQPPPPADPGLITTPVAPPDPGPVATPTPPPERPRSDTDPGRTTKGHTPITNHLLDDVLPTLDPPEQVVLLRLYRLTRGFRSSRCTVSLGKLITKTRVKRTRLREALGTLEDRGYIRRLPDDIDNPDNEARGMNIEILLDGPDPGRVATPSAERPRSSDDPNKERISNDSSKKGIVRLTPQEIQSLVTQVTFLLGEGKTIEEIQSQFAPTLHPVDWATVRSTAEAGRRG